MDVIPLILTENDVIALGIDYMQLIAECSTNAILEFVKKYLSCSNTNVTCRDVVERSYLPILNQIKFEEDESTVNIVKLLNSLDYDCISAGTSDEDLDMYKSALDFFLRSTIAVPYKSPIRVSKINEVIELLSNDTSEYKDTYKNIATKIKKHKLYFKDPNSAGAKGTIFKHVCKNREMLELLRGGIDFIQTARSDNIQCNQWRHL